MTKFSTTLSALNAFLLVATSAIGILLWARGDVEAGTVAMAVPLAWTIANTAGWVSWEMNRRFREHRSVVQERHGDHCCAKTRRSIFLLPVILMSAMYVGKFGSNA